MGVGRIGIEAGVLHFIHRVGAVGENLVFDAVELVTDDEGLELYAETVGQHAAFGK